MFALILGSLLVVLALVTPDLRRTDGSLLPHAWTLIVGALSLLIVTAARGSRWQRPLQLLALALIGQACALALIDAPNYGVLQRYLTWSTLLTTAQGFLLLGPLAQTIVVVREAQSWRRFRFPAAKRVLSTWQMLVLAATVVVLAAYPSWKPITYLGELSIALWVIAINAGNLILVAATIPEDALESLARRVGRPLGFFGTGDRSGPDWDRLFPWLVAAFVTVVAAIIASAVFERIPHIADSVAYYFQAKYLSVGRLYLPPPPDVSAFAFENLHTDGVKWWSYGFPGWPALLAVGVRLGVPWLINPVLGGITVLLAHALLSRLYDRRFAHAGIALIAVSPWFLFLYASFLTHPASIVWALTALLAVDKAREQGSVRWSLVTGAALGALFLTRPFEAFIFGAIIGLYILGVFDRRPRLAPSRIAALTAAGLAVSVWLFPYNNLLTGSPTSSPHSTWASARWYPGADRLGFGSDIGNLGWTHIDPLPGHGLPDVLINALQNLFTANFELYGWMFGSLVLVTMFVMWGRWKPADRVFLAIIAAVIFAYSFYWFSGGPDFGARYWFQIFVPLIVLTVRAVQELQRRWVEGGARPQTALRVPAFVIAASLVAFLNVVPWRALGKYHDYRGLNASVGQLARTYDFGRSLVLVRGNLKYDYRQAFVFNPPTLQSDGTIYARDRGPAVRAALFQYFPDRPVWIIARSPVDESKFVVVAGPLACSETGSCRQASRSTP